MPALLQNKSTREGMSPGEALIIIGRIAVKLGSQISAGAI